MTTPTTSPARGTWFRRLVVLGAIAAAFVIGLSLRGGPSTHEPPGSSTGAETTENVTWTCSMHPQIQLPSPGACPICGMDLIPLEPPSDADAGSRTLTLSPSAQAIAEVRTSPVERRAVDTSLRTLGRLAAAETRVREISARVDGRIEHMHVDQTGVMVNAGEALFDLYSPELISAQEELLQARRTAEILSDSSSESSRRSARRTIEAARERLRLWGLTAGQIDAIEQRGHTDDAVGIVAPISGVVLEKSATEGSYVQTGQPVYTIADLSLLWLHLDVYEKDLAWIDLGRRVEFETEAYPGITFTGTVTFVDPTVDERSRSVAVRVDVPNPDGRLKPGMFAHATVYAPIPGHDDVLPLVIPRSAPLVTGTRAIVYVADPGAPGRFHGREVVLGPRAGDYVVVREGLREGERVVSQGGFKIDSALQILAKESMMSPSDGSSPMHEHGAGHAHPELGTVVNDLIVALEDVPDAFRVPFDRVVSGYMMLGTALSQDHLAASHLRANETAVAVAEIDASELPDAGRSVWEAIHGEMSDALDAIARADDIGGVRLAFFDLSNAVIRGVRAFGGAGQVPVYVFHCPMAMDGRGADWLQPTISTENPYYGSQMFSCGSRGETLVAGPPEATSDVEPGAEHAHD